jgi:hypothetical protein
MPKTSQQRTQPELPQQQPQVPSPLVESKKPTFRIGFGLLTGLLVLVLIASVAAWQASKSSSSTKTVSQATPLVGGPAQATHDMDHNLTVDTSQATHDMDHNLAVDPVQATHDMDHTLAVDPVQATHDMDHVLSPGP